MQLKASTEYGLRAVLYLAHKGELCSSRDIAREMSIPRDYLIQLAQLLRNAGIVEARPGKHGGYRLAKDPAKITLLSIMEALEETARNVSRETRRRSRETPMAEKVRRAYTLALDSYDAYLDSITVEMLLECSDSQEAWEACLAAHLLPEGTSLAPLTQDRAARTVPY